MPFLKMRIGRLPMSSVFRFIMQHATFAQADDVAARIGRDAPEYAARGSLRRDLRDWRVQIVD